MIDYDTLRLKAEKNVKERHKAITKNRVKTFLIYFLIGLLGTIAGLIFLSPIIVACVLKFENKIANIVLWSYLGLVCLCIVVFFICRIIINYREKVNEEIYDEIRRLKYEAEKKEK